MSIGPGHNGGPTMEAGASWRRHAWIRARTDLLPTLPIEVVRLRVRRAAELGLPYRTYASVRAQTGHDVIGFLFSSNALRLGAADAPAAERGARLMAITGADRNAVVFRPHQPDRVARAACIDAAHPAPSFALAWGEMRGAVRDILRQRGLPADRVLMVGETAFERDWAEAARMAGFLSGERYFAVP